MCRTRLALFDAMQKGRCQVVHVIACLEREGAQVALCRLLARMKSQGVHSQVISLIDVGPVGLQIRQLGIPVRALGMRRTGVPDPLAVLRLAWWLARHPPHVVKG